MPLNKHPFGRYQVIDRELRKNDWIKTRELRELIYKEFGINVTTRQLQKDIEAMQNDSFLGWEAPIAYDKSNKAYRYTDKTFSIKNFNLIDEEVLALKFYAASMNQYKEHGLFKDFSNALQKVVEVVSIKSQLKKNTNSRLVVQTDDNHYSRGNIFLTSIAGAIEKRTKIDFDYRKFGEEESKKRIFSPFLLKEYKNRWYVIGKMDNIPSITTFALDRMDNINILSESFEVDSTFNHEKYFKYSFGITKPDEPAVKIILLFTVQQGHYVKSLPIHHSQKIISDNSKGVKISIEVIPSYELYEYLLGQASSVKVVSPKWLAEDMKKAYRNAIDSYRKR